VPGILLDLVGESGKGIGLGLVRFLLGNRHYIRFGREIGLQDGSVSKNPRKRIKNKKNH
jgi:hypothetical protein